MLELVLIGIGSGNPEHLTLQAIREMNACDLLLLPCKGEDKKELLELRRSICTDHLEGGTQIAEFDMPVRDASNPSYKQGVEDWHNEIAQCWIKTIEAAQHDVKRAGLLVWGDPSLYDSTLRIAGKLPSSLDVRMSVVPGITSLQCLTAAHSMPLNLVGEPVLITTGRQLRDNGFPENVNTVAVMLDGECSFQHIAPEGMHIWWGAYVGMEQEIVLSGALLDMIGTIVEQRAQARKQHGWIMDIYTLRREKETG